MKKTTPNFLSKKKNREKPTQKLQLWESMQSWWQHLQDSIPGTTFQNFIKFLRQFLQFCSQPFTKQLLNEFSNCSQFTAQPFTFQKISIILTILIHHIYQKSLHITSEFSRFWKFTLSVRQSYPIVSSPRTQPLTFFSDISLTQRLIIKIDKYVWT